ncbi:MAG: 50S ribosomal protein L24 [Candidatus Levybacteria bacterium RIFOXYA1_FULL_41_10]|nr:MAG: 50S ribosomal protein L24 [Candidatus Levybacteria bacterium GW2011_GWA1_39_34]KKR50657.1 MAG: 50S ribosomal protein L24 [Candidatus Levybacteria bacterium GW2011_GWC1_40_19]KKR72536.1 MAG: 50S ribosomal protein L24 [Candidatus Levybacteria bacterium GW2011_GWC2_40_7]KKR95342.1 MAG: 50S ribosomal protein L24 [Candidatus Levybacteria bacterium GW2011_GWA2_41_15]KKS01849.1 MAG: 50S ribosomal protein L24 [Candidatus Levybacteria bacterium GW2011_GWB1_41_21]OGH20225.1 MAG: 50S ribosomal pr
MKLIKGDEVQVIRGKDKGKRGNVEKVLRKSNAVLLPGLNLYKRHMKAKSQRQKSEIITLTKPIALANVAIICPNCKKMTRVGYRIDKDEKKRICLKCKKII